MKILEANVGPLTNFEVLNFLKSKGASKDPTRVLADVAPSEYKVVYDYLVETAACNQTPENINEFLEKSKKYDLAKAEVLNIINIRPTTPVEIYSMIEQCDDRFGDTVEELVEIVAEVLPPPPTEVASDEVTNEANLETGNKENDNKEQVNEGKE
ncbi:RNA polymerase II, Rpb [Trema orientale]|uniref:DNA-directed RNA polymerase III subunit RPC9 n=1 Tax=Trema orientale TaxID=63057 RepID=A0A2P5FWD3_TREOI|nr:RNA polymerase II, Rpb [Trema orientale]